MHVEALIGAALPIGMFIGSAVIYYCGTESCTEQTPAVYRGDAEGEPWGTPSNSTRKFRFPGERVYRSQRDAGYDTTHIPKIIDTEGNGAWLTKMPTS
jgi:hypothetical protein